MSKRRVLAAAEKYMSLATSEAFPYHESGGRMINNTMLCYVAEPYLDALTKFDNRIEQKATRPYYIIRPEEDGFIYAVPITTKPNNWYGETKSQLCTTLLIDPRGKEPVGLLVFNNMIPVPPEVLIPMPEERFTPFSLCTRQLRAIRTNADEIKEKAIKTLDSRTRGNNKLINSIAVDFRFLESRVKFLAKSKGYAVPSDKPDDRLTPPLHL
jgi:hypothetical protein